MADVLVRRLDDAVKQRLKKRAERHGRSLEQEVRDILEHAALPAEPDVVSGDGVGQMMQARARKTGFTKSERMRYEWGIRQINSTSDMRIPDFET